MPRILTAFIFVVFPLSSALTVATRGLAQSPGTAPAVALASLDRTVDPCVDFYQFACGGWVANHPIPSDRSNWATFDELQERNDQKLHDILEAAAAKPTTETKKIGDYYRSCMDETGINAKAVMPLQSELDRIDSMSNRSALPTVLSMLHQIGTPAFFVSE